MSDYRKAVETQAHLLCESLNLHDKKAFEEICSRLITIYHYAHIKNAVTPTPDHGAVAEEIANDGKIRSQFWMYGQIVAGGGSAENKNVLPLKEIAKILASHYPARDGLVEAVRAIVIYRERWMHQFIKDSDVNPVVRLNSIIRCYRQDLREISEALTSAPVKGE